MGKINYFLGGSPGHGPLKLTAKTQQGLPLISVRVGYPFCGRYDEHAATPPQA